MIHKLRNIMYKEHVCVCVCVNDYHHNCILFSNQYLIVHFIYTYVILEYIFCTNYESDSSSSEIVMHSAVLFEGVGVVAFRVLRRRCLPFFTPDDDDDDGPPVLNLCLYFFTNWYKINNFTLA